VRTRNIRPGLSRGRYASYIGGKTVGDLFVFFAPDIRDSSFADWIVLCFVGAHCRRAWRQVARPSLPRELLERRSAGKCDDMPGATKFLKS
jgi:hypothetical protein